jgi:hypothetical protein
MDEVAGAGSPQENPPMENACSNPHESAGCCGPRPRAACGHAACGTRSAAGCRVERSMEMWACAGHAAWKEVHVDLLKAKILKRWGARMEKTADAVIEAMGIEWQAMLAQGKAKEVLQEKIAQIFAEGAKS